MSHLRAVVMAAMLAGAGAFAATAGGDGGAPGETPDRVAAASPALPPLARPAPDCDRRIQARSFLVTDGRGRTLAALRPDARREVASLTKLMTAELVLRAGDLGRTVTVPPLSLAADESSVGLRAGQRLSRRALVGALLVPSGNDAAEALAASTLGSRRAFVAAMNRRARSLGLTRTTYANPSGLPDRDQRSSARDVVALGRLLMGDRRFRALARSRSIRLNGRTFLSTNTLLGRARGVDGVKTGSLAGNWSILASARRGARRVFAAVLAAPTREARDRDTHCLLTLLR